MNLKVGNWKGMSSRHNPIKFYLKNVLTFSEIQNFFLILTEQHFTTAYTLKTIIYRKPIGINAVKYEHIF